MVSQLAEISKMLKLICLSLLVLVNGGFGHESGPVKGETIQQYAQRHMSSEHHIDSFDIRSFFQLHDLNRDGFWDRGEIEAVYGVHHAFSQEQSKDEKAHKQKADDIVKAVRKSLDLNRDGRITAEELEQVGLDGLPNFEGLGAEGHHYDVESEFFLHHEEQFHSTPETQTDESYTHPEDLAHFAQHEAIERKEAEREAKFQGVPVEDILKAQEALNAQQPNPVGSRAEENLKVQEGLNAQLPNSDGPQAPVSKPVNRVPPPEKQDPLVKFKDAHSEGARKGEWGTGEGGYKPPTEAGDKMRKNLPYKYKFRRSWGDF